MKPKRSLPMLAGLVLSMLFVLAITRAQTVGDDLSTALVNHGMDSVSAPIAAAGIEFLITNNKDLLARIATDETAIAQLQSTSSGLATTLASLSAAPADFVYANTPVGSSGVVSTAATGDSGGGMKLLPNPGQWYDYLANVPVAGNYIVSVRMYTAPITVHFEYPAGANVSGPLVNTGTAQSTIVGTQAFALPAGLVRIRMVIDSGSNAAIHWFTLTKQ